MFYCPSGQTEQIVDRWEYGGGYSVIGYVILFEGLPRVRPEYTNRATGDPPPQHAAGRGGSQGQLIYIPQSQRELAVDTVISTGDNNFLEVQGRDVRRTNHVDGTNPAGGNIVFMDGHVSWRPFSEMDDTKVIGTPKFWW